MNFEFSEEQLLLRTSVRGFLEREWPAAALRRAWESDEPPSALWPKLGSLGVTITLPEASGGLGGDELDLVLALEECGRAALPLRVGELAAAAGLLAAADNDLARAWLPKIADGSATLALGLAEQPYVAGVSVAGLVLLEVEAGVCAVAPDRCRVLAQPSFAPARDLASLEVEPGRASCCRSPATSYGWPGTAARWRPQPSWWALPSGCSSRTLHTRRSGTSSGARSAPSRP